ncbi:putative ribonuclease ZC3H12C [Araneus ventricosus]|uniref:Putative ribonuclease ZC3H12C n=1 Tax=Araneus ventricosus TaxID=182803 RepID=A0A4Y2SM19_ARAVE|nr:putative ribonuclease ZC3H12C [Araneus ventricosus]
MENLLLSPVEQKLVLKSKNFLERKYNVNISLPEYVSLCERDVVVATIHGAKINLVKNFIQRRMVQMKRRQEQRITVQNNITTITLSDSDSDGSFPVLMETQQKGKKKQTRKRKKRRSENKESNELVDFSSTVLVEDSGESAIEDPVSKRPKDELPPPVDFVPLNAEKENTAKFNEIDGASNSSKTLKVESPIPSANFMFLDNAQINGNTSERNALDGTVVLSDSPPPPDFIPLSSGKGKGNTPIGIDDSDIIIEDEIPRPIVNEPRCLRPIVIDGSNVAREHGKVSNTFSCKGIKIAIDYFMQRGHTQVTAFVPQYRRHNKYGPIFTTDQPLLEELSKGQHVVFTPSRRIENKRVTCYDDRFIVELATRTGGVILSNDNYRDLAAESEEYKKTINERLVWKFTLII